MPRMPREIRLERDLKAVALRKAGYEYETIARECGYNSRTNAWYAVQRILKAATREAADELRTLEVQRLDDIMRPQYAQAIKGNQAAVDRVLRIMERRAKLLGLDAPTQVQTENVTEVRVVFSDLDIAETDADASVDYGQSG